MLLKLPKIQFDFGALRTLPGELSALGVERPLLVTDQGLVQCGAFDRVRRVMPAAGRYGTFEDIPENPTEAGVERALAAYRAENCDGIVAVGGGSVIDSAKALSVLATNPPPLANYQGHPERIVAAPAPLVAIPTTAGTGSEASPGAGIHPDASSRSRSLASPQIVPRVAICDPELTLSLPPRLTAGTGMDALSHCVEGFLAKTVNPLVDAIALQGIACVIANIERAVADGGDRDSRWQMMMAGLAGGISIAKGLGPAHALANTFGDRGFHHGMLVTIALPATLRVVARHAPQKMARLAEALRAPSADEVPEAINALATRVGLPSSLGELGHSAPDLDEAAADAEASHFNARAPYAPSREEYRRMIREIL